MTARAFLSLLAGLAAVSFAAACGSTGAPTPSSSGGAPTSQAATPTPATVAGGGSINVSSCASASTVGSTLGITVSAPTTLVSNRNLPSGATAIGCEYMAPPAGVVLVILASGVPSGWYTTEEQMQQQSQSAAGLNISFTPISGIGSDAATYDQTIGGRTRAGCLAQSGGGFVGVFTGGNGTSASLSQIENLVKQLL
jgi:hypothetical protein